MLSLRSLAMSLLLLFSSLLVFSQDNIRYYSNNNKIILKITPLSIIDFKNPLIMLGAEYTFRNRLAVEFGYGIPFNLPKTKRNDLTLHSDLKLRAGVKYYFSDIKKYRGFVMLRCHYREMLLSGDQVAMETTYDLYDYRHVKLVRRSLNPGMYIGGAFIPDGHFFFDWYAGIVQYNLDVDIIEQDGVYVRGRTFGWFKPSYLNYSRDSWGFYPSAGISLGYVFGKISR